MGCAATKSRLILCSPAALRRLLLCPDQINRADKGRGCFTYGYGVMMSPSVLPRARVLIEPAMREAIDSLDARLRLPITYHLGWTDEKGNPGHGDSGKGIRSTLAVLGAEAVSEVGSAAALGAVAVELIHNFSLIHDDIMDRDDTRRHRPTVWSVYGVAEALLVGDALHTLAIETLLGSGNDPARVQATVRLLRATAEMIAGQAHDMSLEHVTEGTSALDACLEMEAKKTGAILRESIAIGAILGGANREQISALQRYGEALGAGFQAIDDVLGIWGDPARTGKPVGNDLREHKISLPVAIAIDRRDELAVSIAKAYEHTLSDETVAELSQRLELSGVRTETEELAQKYLDQATEALKEADLMPTAVEELEEVAAFIISRDR